MQLLSSKKFCCIWLRCGNRYKCPETIHKVFALHALKQKKLYVKHQCSKKYWIFTFRVMNFPYIMSEAVLSIEKSCPAAHAFEHILWQCWTLFWKSEKRNHQMQCALFYASNTDIFMSPKHSLLVFQVRTNKAWD